MGPAAVLRVRVNVVVFGIGGSFEGRAGSPLSQWHAQLKRQTFSLVSGGRVLVFLVWFARRPSHSGLRWLQRVWLEGGGSLCQSSVGRWRCGILI